MLFIIDFHFIYQFIYPRLILRGFPLATAACRMILKWMVCLGLEFDQLQIARMHAMS